MMSQSPEKPFRLSHTSNPGLVVVDIQEKFKPAVPAFDAVATGSIALIKGFKTFGFPVVATEQYPKGLGSTVDNVAAALAAPPAVVPLTKKYFSCFGADGFHQQFELYRINTVLVCGIETHVCVYQTVLDLLEKGFQTVVVVDACGSRKELDHATALKRMESSGAILMTVEMILFDLLKSADAEKFKDVQRLVK